ncbi:urease accessory protein UreD [Propylenella binzhouense]|uniref:Urease accessory protein UreD n=1 Tax=Propylenella binzhouense TaxID=2555902 RepID=A0A964T7D7_9HYPH|nr:urease accessory protein UreD [Propylenella binzhouense]MYZ49800.1 urease accessory protein UreD [Propylenella binzhouense]
MPFAAISPSDPAPGPRLQRTYGRAAIAFKADGARTRLDRLFQEGAAKIRLPRAPAGAPPQAVLINTAGGLTGGDRLAYEVALRAGCRATLTTQACEKIYRASGGEAEIGTALRLAAGSRLDWLPQEAILFDGARLSRRLDAELAADASLLAVEAAVFGRHAMGEEIGRGLLRDRWRIRRGGELIFADDLRLDWSEADLLRRPAVLDGARAAATVLYVGEDAEARLEDVRSALGGAGAASAWRGKLVARIAAEDGASLRRALLPALARLAPGAAFPRIWHV